MHIKRVWCVVSEQRASQALAVVDAQHRRQVVQGYRLFEQYKLPGVRSSDDPANINDIRLCSTLPAIAYLHCIAKCRIQCSMQCSLDIRIFNTLCFITPTGKHYYHCDLCSNIDAASERHGPVEFVIQFPDGSTTHTPHHTTRRRFVPPLAASPRLACSACLPARVSKTPSWPRSWANFSRL